MRGALVVERTAGPEGPAIGRSAPEFERRMQVELNHSKPVAFSLDVSDMPPGFYRVSFRPEAHEHGIRRMGFIVLEARASD